MSGYRDRSAFDPNAGGGEALPPPPTWVQRIGIACLFVGAVVVFAYIAGKLGLIPQWIDSPVLGTVIIVLAGPLMGARRGPLSPAAKRRQMLIMGTAVAVCVVAAALVVYFKGA